MTIEIVRAFLGWCTVIHMGLLMFSSIMLVFARDWIYGIQSKWFKISAEQFNGTIYSFLAFYKIGIFLFSMVPYFAVCIID